MNTRLKLFLVFIYAVIFYLAISSATFQWRNPLANQMSFFRDFKSVVKFEKLEKYQAK